MGRRYRRDAVPDMTDIYSSIEKLLTSGGSISGIRKLCADREWLSDDVDSAIQSVYESLLHGKVDCEGEALIAIKRLTAIYLNASSKGDWTTALNAQREINTMVDKTQKRRGKGSVRKLLDG